LNTDKRLCPNPQIPSLRPPLLPPLLSNRSKHHRPPPPLATKRTSVLRADGSTDGHEEAKSSGTPKHIPPQAPDEAVGAGAVLDQVVPAEQETDDQPHATSHHRAQFHLIESRRCPASRHGLHGCRHCWTFFRFLFSQAPLRVCMCMCMCRWPLRELAR